MFRYLFDTDHLTLNDLGHAQVTQRLAQEPQGTVATSAVTIEECLRGRLASVSQARSGADRIQSYDALIASLRMLRLWYVVPFDQACEDQFRLLRSQKIRIGTQDLKIAAIALANNLIVVTRNQ